jgi:hypothetical protein
MLVICFLIGSGTFFQTQSSSVSSKHLHHIGDILRTNGQGIFPTMHFILLIQLRHILLGDRDEVQETVILNGQVLYHSMSNVSI